MNRDKERARLLALFEDDEIKVQTVLNFRHKLTPVGFEVYVSRFFRTYSSFNTFEIGGFSDHGIDIKWVRKDANWNPEYLIVQCKKWSAWGIKEKDLAEFFGKVASLKFQHPNTSLVYATTGEVNIYAKRFAEKNSIILADYSDLIEMQSVYPLNQFATEILTDWNYDLNELFEKSVSDYILTQHSKKQQGGIIAKMKSAKDLHFLLKELRTNIAKEERIPSYTIFNNKTLEDICLKRPSSLHELESIHGFGQKRIQKYWLKILEAIA